MRYAMNKTKYLLEPEMRILQATLERHKDADTRNCTVLWLLLHTGARATEVLNVTAGDINHTERSVLLRGIKGSNDREIPLPLWLYRRVVDLGSNFEPSNEGVKIEQRLFPISYSRLKQIWDLYRPVPKKLHATRHTFAIRLYEKTKDIRLVQSALGHRSISNTMVYADYLYTQQEMRRLIL